MHMLLQDAEKRGGDDEETHILAQISQVASAISPVILPMIESLDAIDRKSVV